MKFEVEIKLSPADLAAAFVEMDDQDQAEVFAEIWRELKMSSYRGHMQCAFLCRAIESRPDARKLLDELRE